jgi:transposase
MVPVIKWEIRVLIRHLLEQGLCKAAIARQAGVNRRTINRWIAEGQLDREVTTEELPRPVGRSRAPNLEAFKAIIQARLEAYRELTAVRLFEELKAVGYAGGISQLRDYVALVRPRPVPEPLVRFETEAGHQAQADFAEFSFPWGKRYALLLVLDCSG